jgi:uncharacterized protein YkwD
VLPRTRAALATAAAIVVAGASVSAVSAAAPLRAHARNLVTALPALDRQVIAGINAARAQHGLGRLRLSLRLRAAATFHSYEMARDGFFSHDSANGASPWTRLARYYPSAGYTRWQVGETLLWYSPDVGAAGVVHDWLTSPEHRAILLTGAFREIGVAAVHSTAATGDFNGDEITLVTADFGFRAR